MRRALALGVLTAILVGLALSGSALAGPETNPSSPETCGECHPTDSPDFRQVRQGCSCHTGHDSLDPSRLQSRASKLSTDRIHKSHRDRTNPAAQNSNCNTECHGDTDLSCTGCHESHNESIGECTECHGAFPAPTRHETGFERGKHSWVGDCDSCHADEHVTRFRVAGVSKEPTSMDRAGEQCLVCHRAANRTHNSSRLNGTAIDRCPTCHDPHSTGVSEDTQDEQVSGLLQSEPPIADVFLDYPDFSSTVRTRTGRIASIILLAMLLAGVYELSPKSWREAGPRQVYHQVVSVATASDDTLELRVSADRRAALLVLDYLEDQAVEVLASAIDSEDEQLTAVLDSPRIGPEALENQLSQIEGVEEVDVS